MSMSSGRRTQAHNDVPDLPSLNDWKARGNAVTRDLHTSIDQQLVSPWGREFYTQVNHVPSQWEVERWRRTCARPELCGKCKDLGKSLCVPADGDDTGIVGCKRCKREGLYCSFREDFFAWFIKETMGVTKRDYQVLLKWVSIHPLI